MQVAYYLWLCSLTALSIFILTFFPQRAQYIETGLLRLLPDNNQVLVVNHAWKAFSDNIDKKVIFLVGNSDPDLTIRAGESLYKGLKASEYFNDVHFRIDINQQIQTFSTYSKHHRGLLSNEDRKRLQMGNEQIILDNALKMMYSPITYNVNHLIHIDPFFLLPNYLNSIKKYAGSPGEGGEVLFYDNDIIYTQIMASINGDHYSLENQIHLFNALQKITDKVEHDNPGIQVLKTGSIFYAHAASTEARAEVSFIGLGSLLGIILLVSMVFRSLAPLLLSLLSITFGILLSIAVTLFFFPRIHLFTLVFGANLIGVSVDYAFHYFTASADDNTSLHPIKRILPGITFGVLTSVIAYAALGIAPFPGLHQLALFSSVGLIGAYITVIVLFPKIPALNGLKLHQLWLSKLSGFILNAWNNLQGLRLMAVLILFALFIYYGLSNLKIEDDVRLLHSEFKDLKIQEEKIRNIIDQSYSNQLMIVQAESNEELQKREEEITDKLYEMTGNQLDNFLAISDYVPSISRQQDNYQLVNSQLMNHKLDNYADGIGMRDSDLISLRQHWSAAFNPLTMKIWLHSTGSNALQYLWLGEVESRRASIIILRGVKDRDALLNLAAAIPDTIYYSKSDEVTGIFHIYRTRISYLAILGYTVIFFLLLSRYSLYQSILILVPPVMAAITSASMSGWLGLSWNLFSILGTILTLGIGIDYTIFLAESREHSSTTMLAIWMSALTTILAFGLLAFSRTPALYTFGATVSFGIISALLFAPLVLRAGRNNK